LKIFVDASLIIYLNIKLPKREARIIENFYHNLLEEELYTNVLVLDEAISRKNTEYRLGKH